MILGISESSRKREGEQILPPSAAVLGTRRVRSTARVTLGARRGTMRDVKDGFALEGMAAIDLIVARAAPAIAAAWDGGTERVAFIVSRGTDSFDIGFADRADATAQLHTLSTRVTPAEAARLRSYAAELKRGAQPGIQCVLLGFGDAMLVEIEPEDIRNGVPAQPVPNERLAELLAICATREGASRELAEIRLVLRAETGCELAELAALEEVVERDWTNLAALSSAIDRARAAAGPLLPTAAGQRARLVLDMLEQATSDRGGIVNAPGGVA
jgi:hypothetical protein